MCCVMELRDGLVVKPRLRRATICERTRRCFDERVRFVVAEPTSATGLGVKKFPSWSSDVLYQVRGWQLSGPNRGLNENRSSALPADYSSAMCAESYSYYRRLDCV